MQMNIFPAFRCYRCKAATTVKEPIAPSRHGEILIRYECTMCGQGYEVAAVITFSIYALSSQSEAEEAVAMLQLCDSCGQLYLADETHTCSAEELNSKIADLIGGETALIRLWSLGADRLERLREGVEGVWQPVTNATLHRHQSALTLLHMLISSPGRGLSREQAIEMLWPELDFETASHRLDKAVYNLRRLLEPGRSRLATANLLLIEHQTLMLANQSKLWIDADAFESLFSQAHGNLDPGQTEQLLEEAALLYSGDFLPEEHDAPWTQPRREALQHSWVSLLLELADLRIAREALPAAIDTLDRLLMVDPANEAAVQRLITLFIQSGRRAEARHIYQRFAAALSQEFKITPLKETRELLRRSGR